jgi:hypothetical protein
MVRVTVTVTVRVFASSRPAAALAKVPASRSRAAGCACLPSRYACVIAAERAAPAAPVTTASGATAPSLQSCWIFLRTSWQSAVMLGACCPSMERPQTASRFERMAHSRCTARSGSAPVGLHAALVTQKPRQRWRSVVH